MCTDIDSFHPLHIFYDEKKNIKNNKQKSGKNATINTTVTTFSRPFLIIIVILKKNSCLYKYVFYIPFIHSLSLFFFFMKCSIPQKVASVATQAAAVATIGHIHLEQFPSIEQFDAIIHDYLQNLSTKKRDKALVDNHRYAMILQVLKDPRNTSVSTAQFRFWVKKMFCLMNDTVCHDDKPVATRESIYHILVIAHKEAHHGGRDKTSALVKTYHT